MPEQEEAVQPMPLAVVTDNPIDRPRTAAEIRGGINLIQEVMRDCMKDKVHYGTVPGCGDKPTLLKAGVDDYIFLVIQYLLQVSRSYTQ